MDIRQTEALYNNFIGPDENPLYDSGRWDFVAAYDYPLRRHNNSATDNIHPTVLSGPISYSYFTQETVDMAGDWEVWACTDGGQLGAALEDWRIAVWDSPWTLNGYTFLYGGALSKFFEFRSYTGTRSGYTSLGTFGGGYPTMMLMRRNGANVEGWASYDYGANWTLIAAIADSAHISGHFYLALGIEDPTNGGLSFGCFGGGIIHRTQYYRWFPAIAQEVA